MDKVNGKIDKKIVKKAVIFNRKLILCTEKSKKKLDRHYMQGQEMGHVWTCVL